MKLIMLTAMLNISGTLESFAGCNAYIAIFTTTAAIASFYGFKKMK